MHSLLNRLKAGRRWIVLVFLIGLLLTGTFILMLPKPSINVTVSGAVNGRLQFSNFFCTGANCSLTTVTGIVEWSGNFPVMLNGHATFFSAVVTDYHGPGRYTDAPINDVRILTQHPYGRTRDTSVHAILSLAPPGQLDATVYSSDPDPITFGHPPAQAIPFGPVGQGSLTVDPGEESGEIDAVLMNAKTLDAQPVHVVSSFKCTRLERGSP